MQPIFLGSNLAQQRILIENFHASNDSREAQGGQEEPPTTAFQRATAYEEARQRQLDDYNFVSSREGGQGVNPTPWQSGPPHQGFNMGMPPYGTPPYNMPPYGMSPYNMPPHGMSPYNMPPHGMSPYNMPAAGMPHYLMPQQVVNPHGPGVGGYPLSTPNMQPFLPGTPAHTPTGPHYGFAFPPNTQRLPESGPRATIIQDNWRATRIPDAQRIVDVSDGLEDDAKEEAESPVN